METNKTEAIDIEIVEGNELQAKQEVLDSADKIKNGLQISSDTIMNFGSDLTSKVTTLSVGNENVKSFDEVGQLVSDTLKVLSADPFEDKNKKKGFLGMLQKAKNNVASTFQEVQLAYLPMRQQIEKAELLLRQEQRELITAAKNTEKHIAENIKLHDEIQAHIIAGKQSLNEYRNGELMESYELTKGENGEMYMNEYLAKQHLADSFETRLNSLEQTRAVIYYTVPALQLTRKNDSELALQLETLIAAAIPTWRTQLTVYTENQRGEKATQTISAVRNATNELIVKVSEQLKETTMKVDLLGKQDFIEMQTFETVHNNLIDILSSTNELTDELRERRMSNNKRLQEMAIELNRVASQNPSRLVSTEDVKAIETK